MQRYFLEQPFDEAGTVKVTGEDGKHIVRVMRMEIGDQVIACHNGEAAIAAIAEILPDGAVLAKQQNLEGTREMPVHVAIACGLPKGDKLDLIAQKGTELGMSRLIPFTAQRSVVKWNAQKGDKRVERLRKIAKEAAEQCHRNRIPEIDSPQTLKQLIETAADYDVRLFADEEEAKSGQPHKIADRLKNVYHKQSILVVFGPEGGLSREEAGALEQSGFLPIALGPRILRTETAPLYFLSSVSYEFE